jgi:hypothetical protein
MVRAELDTHVGPWFQWTAVDLDRLTAIAAAIGLDVIEAWDSDCRRFAVLAPGR